MFEKKTTIVMDSLLIFAVTPKANKINEKEKK